MAACDPPRMLDLQILVTDIMKHAIISEEVSIYLTKVISDGFLKKLVNDLNERNATRTRDMYDVLSRITTGIMQKQLQFRVRRFFKDEDVELELVYSEEDIMYQLNQAGLTKQISHDIYVCCSILIEYLYYNILRLALYDVEHQKDLSIENIKNAINLDHGYSSLFDNLE